MPEPFEYYKRGENDMNKYAVIIGEAPEDYRMKKTEEMYDFLRSDNGGTIPSGNIIDFPQGLSELMLESVLDRMFDSETQSILLYFCTKTSVSNSSPTFFIGGEEIRFDVIEYYQNLAKKAEIDLQVIYDVCSEFISEDELGYEKIS